MPPQAAPPYDCPCDKDQVLRDHAPRGRRAGSRQRRLGGRADLLAEVAPPRPAGRCGRDRRGGQAARRGRRGVRQPGARLRRGDRRRGRPDDGPAARGRRTRVLRRGGAPHRLQGHQSRPRPQWRGRPGAGVLPHRLPPARQLHTRGSRRNRRVVLVGTRARLSPARPPGPGDPVGRADVGQRRRCDRGRPSLRRRRRQRSRADPRPQGPRQARGIRGGGPLDDARGGRAVSTLEHRFGPYGGQYVPETLMPALCELEEAWDSAQDDGGFRGELDALLRDFVGRPSPLYLAQRLSEAAGHPIWLKREDLNHTGAHKINNALGQALLAKRMGKRRIIAETGAGQHGVAAATVCALLDLECVIYMGAEDVRRQAPNVQRMDLLGAKVVSVEAGAKTLKKTVSEAIRDWVTTVATSHYIIGSAVGPAPYPALVRDLQR